MNIPLNVFSKIGLVLLLSFGLFSCTKYKEIPYFQDVPTKDSSIYKEGLELTKSRFESLKIRSGDILQISIQTIAPTSSPTDISSNIGFSSSDWQSAGQIGATAGSSSIPGYLVDNNGEIELPLVGNIVVSGLTVPEIKEAVRGKAKKYFKDPVVNVRLANFKVTILGEVSRPGTYILDQEKATILDALGLAGDMSIYGKRTNVLLTRNINGKEQVARINMNSTDVFSSPFFYLQQGDVLYVQPSKSKASANDALIFQLYSAVLSTLTLAVTIILKTN